LKKGHITIACAFTTFLRKYLLQTCLSAFPLFSHVKMASSAVLGSSCVEQPVNTFECELVDKFADLKFGDTKTIHNPSITDEYECQYTDSDDESDSEYLAELEREILCDPRKLSTEPMSCSDEELIEFLEMAIDGDIPARCLFTMSESYGMNPSTKFKVTSDTQSEWQSAAVDEYRNSKDALRRIAKAVENDEMISLRFVLQAVTDSCVSTNFTVKFVREKLLGKHADEPYAEGDIAFVRKMPIANTKLCQRLGWSVKSDTIAFYIPKVGLLTTDVKPCVFVPPTLEVLLRRAEMYINNE